MKRRKCAVWTFLEANELSPRFEQPEDGAMAQAGISSVIPPIEMLRLAFFLDFIA
jgi:hypothetical protein